MTPLELAAQLAGHLLFPISCPLCGAIATVICPQCLKSLTKERLLPQCLACGGSSPCKSHGERYEVSSLCFHELAARETLLAAKYGNCTALARQLGRCMAPLITKEGPWAIAYIPPHDRLWLTPRGENHLKLMALGLSDVTGFEITACLRWSRPTTPQKKSKTISERKKLAKDCFVCGKLPSSHIILIDDVCTTGTTLLRGAQALYDAGAEEVRCICWSKTKKA